MSGIQRSTWLGLLIALLIVVVCGFFLLLPFLIPGEPTTIFRIDPV